MNDSEKHSIIQFNKWAQTYDKNFISYYHFYYLNKQVTKLLNPQRGSSVLDIGFGTGLLLDQLLRSDKDLRLYGLDISEEMYKKAEAKFSGNPRVNLTLGSANKLPYADGAFDYVTCVHSLHHHADTQQSLKEMYRVLKPGGKVVVIDPSIDGFLRKIFLKLSVFVHNEKGTRHYTKSQMKALFEKAGFKNIRQDHSWDLALINLGEK